MSRIRSRGTKPERRVATALRALSVKFRRHPKLLGRPDFKLTKHRVALFVHGCFWHRHRGCPRTRIPKSRVEFWTEKFLQNTARDRRSVAALRRLGYAVAIIWECETEKPDQLVKQLRRILSTAGVNLNVSTIDRQPKRRLPRANG